jgi:alkylation response protein AidB-like acyl-CoA dehydrogenase
MDRVWNVTGMKGTGSDTLVAEDVRISRNQFCLALGGGAHGSRPDPDEHTLDATDYWTSLPLSRTKGFGVYLGIAEALLGSVMATSQRPVLFPIVEPRGQSSVWQARIGEVAAQISVARRIMEAHCHLLDAAAIEKRPLQYAERALLRGETGIFAKTLISSLETLMSLAGSSAFMLSSPAQRFWRDFNISARHGILNIDLNFEVYGKQLLGVDPNIIPRAAI